jgi:hypothetical protein
MRRHVTRRAPRTRSSHPFWLRAGIVATVAALVSTGLAVQPAQAAQQDVAEAEGSLLSGTGIVGLNSIAQLDPAYSAYGPSDSIGAVNDPLSLSALSALSVDLGNGIHLLGSQGILTLGAAGQYASTTATTATASSGSLGAGGALSTGTGTDGEGATVDLTPLLTQVAPASQVLASGSLQVGALGSSITATRGSSVATSTNYEIASAKLRLRSPAVAALATSVPDAVTGLTANVNALAGTQGSGVNGAITGPLQTDLGALLGGVLTLSGTTTNVAFTVDLTNALSTTLGQTYTEGPVTIVPSTGAVTIDLAKISDLNGKAPNTSLLTDGAIATINTALTTILTQDLPNALTAAITSAIDNTPVTIAISARASLTALGVTVPLADLHIGVTTTLGRIIGAQGAAAPVVTLSGLGLTGALLNTALGRVTGDVTGSLFPALSDLLLPVIGPTPLATLGTTLTGLTTAVNTTLVGNTGIGALLRSIIDVTVNAQDTTTGFRAGHGDGAGASSVHALRLSVLPGANAATVDLATSTVRATSFTAPTITAPTANQQFSVPSASSTRGVTVSGAGEPGGQMTVQIATGRTATATVGADGTWTASFSGVPVGSYTATATQTVGGSAAGGATQSFAVVAQQPLTIRTPTDGQTITVLGPTVPVTVTGTATPGATIAIDLGNGRTASGTAAADGTWSIATPALPAGTYTVNATETVGDTTSAVVSRSFVVATAAALTVTSPADGSAYPVADASGTRSIPFTGTAQAAATVTVDLGNGRTATTTAAADGSWSATVPNVPVGTYTAATTQTVGGVRSAAVNRTVSVAAGAPIVITGPTDGTVITVAASGSTTPVVVTGTSAPSATVDVGIGGAFAATVTADGSGSWVTTFTGVPVGPRTVTARQTVGGTTSAAVTSTFTVAAGSPLVVTAPTDGSTVTVLDAGTTTDLPVTGTAQPGATVSVAVNGSPTRSVTADGSGAWSTTVPDVAVGLRTVAVTQIVNGTSSPTEDRTVTVAAGAPLVVSSPTEGQSITVAQASSTVDVPVSGTAQPGATVSVALGSGTPRTVSAAGDGSWSVTISAVPVGDHTVSVTQTVAGATSATIARDVTVAPGAAVTITTPTAAQEIPATASGSAEVVATGTAQPGATIAGTYSDGTTTTPISATAGSGGLWTAPATGSTPLPVGHYTLSVTETVGETTSDAATRTFDVVPGTAITIDTPPTGSRFVVLSGTTADVTVTGHAAIGASVSVSVGGSAALPATVDGDGGWTVTFPGLPVADYTVNAAQTQGGTTTDAIPTTFRVDAAAPVVVTSPTASESIPIAGLAATKDIPISGTAEPGAGVTVTVAGAPAQTTTAAADGTWTVTLPTLPAGEHTASVTETVGSAVSTIVQRTFSLDPATPVTITSPAAPATFTVPDVGGTRPVTVTGTAAVGAPITVALGAGTRTTTSGADGTWSVTFLAVGSGSYPLTATQTVNGTQASTPPQQLTVAEAAPLTMTAPVAGSTVTVADTDSTVDVRTGGSAQPGASVTVTLSTGATRTVTADGTTGAWTWTFPAVPVGDDTATATQSVDGLTSRPVVTGFSIVAGAALAVTTPAGATSITVADPGAATDVPFSGTGAPGAAVTVDLGQGHASTVPVGGDGNWSTTIPGLPVGTYSAAIDQSISGTTSAALTRTVSVIPAAVLRIRQPADGSTITVADSAATTDVTVAGDAAPGATVTLTADDGDPATATADGSGAWSIVLPGVGTGPHALSATQTVGTSVSTAAVTSGFTVAPGAPLRVTTPTSGQVFRVGDATATTAVTVSGTAQPGATVVVDLGGDHSASVLAGTDGGWSVTAPGLGAADYAVQATQQVGGTVSAAVDVPITIVAADPLTLTAPASGSSIAVAQGDSTTTVQVSGTAQAGATVRVTLDGQDPASVTARSDGTWSTRFAAVGVGGHSLSATQTVSGSTSSAVTSAFSVAAGDRLVVTAPAPGATVTVVDSSTPATIPVTGAAQPGSLVVVSIDGGVPVTTTAAADGTWSASVPDVPTGVHTLSVTQTVGDTTSAPEAQQLTVAAAAGIAFTAPAAGTTVTVADDASITSIPVSGTAEPDAAIAVAIGAGHTATTTASATGTWSVTIDGIATGSHTITAMETVAGVEGRPITRGVTVAAGAPLTVTSPAEGSTITVASATSTTPVVLTGTAQPGALVSVATDGGAPATTTAGPAGAWATSVPGLRIGGHAFDVTQTIGGTVSPTLTRSITIAAGDGIVIETPPTGTVYTVVDGDATHDVTVTGAAQPGAAVTVRTDGADRTTTAGATSGAWTVTFAALPTGTYTVDATQVVDGTASDAPSTFFRIAPAAAVTITSPAPGSTTTVADAGATATIPVTGTAEPGASVAVAIDGQTATVTAGADGGWSAAVRGVPVGDWTIAAMQTVDGLVSIPVDRPVSVAAAAAVRISAPSDGDTRTVFAPATGADVPVRGTAAPGATVLVDLGFGHTATTTAGPDGAWSTTVPSVPEGSYTVAVTQSIGGTTSTPVTLTVAVDVADALVVRAPSDGQAVTSAAPDGSVPVTVSGTAEAGSTVAVTIGGDTESATAGSDGAFTVTVPGVAAGTHSISTTETVAGTSSPADTRSVTIGAAAALRLTAPAAGTTITVADASRTATVPVSGTGQAGATVSVDLGNGHTASTTAAPDGTWSVSVSGVPVGTPTISVTQSIDGTTSAPVTRDVTIAAAATLHVSAPADGADLVVVPGSTASVAVTGTGEPGATIAADLGGGHSGTTTVGPDGAWSLTVDGIGVGPHTASVTQTVDGTASTPVTHDFTVTEASSSVVITAPAAGARLPVVPGGTRSVVVAGTATPGTSVTATIDGRSATADADAVTGSWTATVSGVGAGTHDITAEETDGTAATPVSITVAAAAPVRVTAPRDGSTVSIADGSATATVPVSGTAEPGAVVAVDLGGGLGASTIAGADGSWNLPVSGVPIGGYTVSVTETIAGGGTSSPVTRDVTVRVAAPLAVTRPMDGASPVVFAPTTTADVPVAGTAEPGATVDVVLDGGTPATTTAGADGSWSATLAGIRDGAHAVSVTQTIDGSTSDPITRQITVTAANAVTVTTPARGTSIPTASPTGTASVPVSGTAQPGATITVSDGAGNTATATAGQDGTWTTTLDGVASGPATIGSSETVLGTTSDPVTTPVTVVAATPITIDRPNGGARSTVGTRDDTTTVALTGTAAPDAMVSVRVDGAPARTVTAGPTGVWALSVTGVGVGDHTASATETIGGGTSAAVTTAFSVVPVGAPTITEPTSGSTIPAGRSGTADVTVGGTASPAATVTATVDGGAPVTVTAGLDGTWNTPVTGLAGGTHTVVVTQTVDGTLSDPASTVFTVGPATPAGTIAITSPTPGQLIEDADGNGAEDLTIGGVADPGASVTVALSNGAVAATIADANGTWTVMLPGVPVGRYTIRATETVDGTTTAASPQSVTIAAVDPLVVRSPSNGTVMRAGAAGTVDIPMSGTAEPNALVTVTVDGGDPATTTAGTDGVWTLTLHGVPVGEHVFSATQTIGRAESAPQTMVVTVFAADLGTGTGTGGTGGAPGTSGGTGTGTGTGSGGGTGLPGMTAPSSDPSRTSSAGGLAFTGSDVLPVLGLGLGILLLGFLLLGLSRVTAAVRRRSRRR